MDVNKTQKQLLPLCFRQADIRFYELHGLLVPCWISNSATAAMKMPIAQAVLLELEEHLRTRCSFNATEAVEEAEGNICWSSRPFLLAE